jgi:hypothetical protein
MNVAGLSRTISVPDAVMLITVVRRFSRSWSTLIQVKPLEHARLERLRFR